MSGLGHAIYEMAKDEAIPIGRKMQERDAVVRMILGGIDEKVIFTAFPGMSEENYRSYQEDAKDENVVKVMEEIYYEHARYNG